MPLGYYLGLNPFALILALAFQNAITSLFVIWNYHLLFHLPKVGRHFINLREKCQKLIMKYDARKRASFFGLFLFFIIPFQGSGSLSMSFIGKLIGMQDRKILSISIFGTIFMSAVILLSITGLRALFGWVL